MKLSKATISEIKKVLAYYRYGHLKNNEFLLKVFRVRWDSERKEVFLNQLEEVVVLGEQNITRVNTLLITKHLIGSTELRAIVAINRSGKIVNKGNGDLWITHNTNAKFNENLVMTTTTIIAVGSRAEQSETKPYYANLTD